MRGLRLIAWESNDTIRGYILISMTLVLAIFMKAALMKGGPIIITTGPVSMLNHSLFGMFSFNVYIVITFAISLITSLRIRGEIDEGSAYFIYSLPYPKRFLVFTKILVTYLTSLLTIITTHILIFFLHFSSMYEKAIITIVSNIHILFTFYSLILLYLISLAMFFSSILPNAPISSLFSFFSAFGLANLKIFNPTIKIQEILTGNYLLSLLPYLLVSFTLIPISIELICRRDIR
ncbi:MAG: type transport system permease protein [Pyrococcus sp.]|uniref:ABC transporter permease n=1 Tax=Pyrococcus sp. TaxID=33866 RepID=UPI002590E2BF|nr:ABC transporter permease [Pyrococcus sp.]MDK2868916.1 type transport system permease protein [Pyrococcus sp.]